MPGLEFWFIAALLLAPCVLLGTWVSFSRTCALFWHPSPGFHKYCSNAQTWDWVLHQGGWWKLLLELGVLGILAWAGATDQDASTATADEPAGPDDAPPPA